MNVELEDVLLYKLSEGQKFNNIVNKATNLFSAPLKVQGGMLNALGNAAGQLVNGYRNAVGSNNQQQVPQNNQQQQSSPQDNNSQQQNTLQQPVQTSQPSTNSTSAPVQLSQEETSVIDKALSVTKNKDFVKALSTRKEKPQKTSEQQEINQEQQPIATNDNSGQQEQPREELKEV
jgi:Sec-independent protein translocase protein TatA